MKKVDLLELRNTLIIARNRINNHSDLFGNLYSDDVLDPALKFIDKLIKCKNVRFHYLDINELELANLRRFKEKTIFEYECTAVKQVIQLHKINKRLGSTSKYWMIKSNKLKLLQN